MQLFLPTSALQRNTRIFVPIWICFLSLGLPFLAFPKPIPQGGGTIVLEDVILRAISDSPDDPVIRLEVWRSRTVVHSESACGAPSCSTDLSQLESGSYVAIAYTASGGQFSTEIALE